MTSPCESVPPLNALTVKRSSSDSVPVHLTTREAIALYMDRLAPDGVLVFHISNRYYAIAPFQANAPTVQVTTDGVREVGETPLRIVQPAPEDLAVIPASRDQVAGLNDDLVEYTIVR